MNEKLNGYGVEERSAVTFGFQAEKGTSFAQKNIALRCGETYSYFEFACTDANYCEAKIVDPP